MCPIASPTRTFAANGFRPGGRAWPCNQSFWFDPSAHARFPHDRRLSAPLSNSKCTHTASVYTGALQSSSFPSRRLRCRCNRYCEIRDAKSHKSSPCPPKCHLMKRSRAGRLWPLGRPHRGRRTAMCPPWWNNPGSPNPTTGIAPTCFLPVSAARQNHTYAPCRRARWYVLSSWQCGRYATSSSPPAWYNASRYKVWGWVKFRACRLSPPRKIRASEYRNLYLSWKYQTVPYVLLLDVFNE